jgi:hypothetical protein
MKHLLTLFFYGELFFPLDISRELLKLVLFAKVS